MADKLSKSEFKKSLKEYAAQFKLQIESMNDGFDISPAACQARRKRAFNDFEFFSRTYFPHYIRQKEDEKTGKMRDVAPALFHKWCYENLPRIVKLKTSVSQVIAASRGEAKSTYIMIFTIYCICYGLKHYILFIQDVYEQAAIMIESIKAEFEFNQRLKADFPEIFGKSDIWKEGVFVTRNNIKVHARGAGQKIRGLKHGAYRPDLVALDDIENDELVEIQKTATSCKTGLTRQLRTWARPAPSLTLFISAPYFTTIRFWRARLTIRCGTISFLRQLCSGRKIRRCGTSGKKRCAISAKWRPTPFI